MKRGFLHNLIAHLQNTNVIYLSNYDLFLCTGNVNSYVWVSEEHRDNKLLIPLIRSCPIYLLG